MKPSSRLHIFLLLAAITLSCFAAIAQNSQNPQTSKKIKVSLVLQEVASDEPIGFATVSLTRKGADKAAYYAVANSEGYAEFNGVAPGDYTLKAELLGYNPFSREIEVKGGLNLGVCRMEPDVEQLDAARVSASLNPVVVKKDTVEYSANYFKSTDTDMLADLLKKLPGAEVDENGTVTINGEQVKKITIEGKTFFLNDPQIATQNIPAKMINKLKLIEKKSEQAEFTGIDDGERETVIDLSLNPGRMRGFFANATAGVGRDIMDHGKTSAIAEQADSWRYLASAFAGRFTTQDQIAGVLGGNNTNNQGVTDRTANAMASMRGSQNGGSGISSTWVAGTNGAWTLLGGKMDLSANYVYNYGEREVESASFNRRYYDDYDLETDNTSSNLSTTQGHRIGMKLKHTFSESASIIFEPEIDFGKGDFNERSDFTTSSVRDASPTLTNSGFRSNTGESGNFSTEGHFTYRQRIGIPGRTFTFRLDYNFSHSEMDGFNQSLTRMYADGDESAYTDSLVNQRYSRVSDTRSVTGRFTYTEPIGGGFYIQANYNIGRRVSESVKDTYGSGEFDPASFGMGMGYNRAGESFDPTYSNNIINRSLTQRIGTSLLYQTKNTQVQIGAGANPTHTVNETTRRGKTDEYKRDVMNWAPQAMFRHDFSRNNNIRVNYRGSSSQPSISQLMPVPDNSNPLRISFGNPYLKPSFTHRVTADYRYTDRGNSTTASIRFNSNINTSPVVSASWRDRGGVQYSMPFNGHTTWSTRLQAYVNLPIKKTKFQVYDQVTFNLSGRSSYSGKGDLIDTKRYYNEGEFDYALFNDDYSDIDASSNFIRSKTSSMNISEQIRLTYRADNLEMAVGGTARMNHITYSISDSTAINFNNRVNARVNWSHERSGFNLETRFSYRWYMLYARAPAPEAVWSAQISKTMLRRKGILSLQMYDILGQEKAVSVSDGETSYRESVSNTLGRYIILSFTYRFNDNRGRRTGPGGGNSSRRGSPGGGFGGGRR